MGKFYTANDIFAAYLMSLGFKFHDREETSKYYAHSSGKQVKIDMENSLISLLDNKGKTIDYSSSFTDTQIEEFLNN